MAYVNIESTGVTVDSSYKAVMLFMKGNEFTDICEHSFDNANYSAHECVELMGKLERMFTRDVLYVTAASLAGYSTYDDEDTAIERAMNTHPSQHPAAYKVTKPRKGEFCVKVLWDRPSGEED